MSSLQIVIPSITIPQGDSSGKYVLQSKEADFSDSEWSCKMKFKQDTADGELIFEKNIPYDVAEDGYVVGLSPNNTSVELGKYVMIVEIKNEELLFNREVLEVDVYIEEQNV